MTLNILGFWIQKQICKGLLGQSKVFEPSKTHFMFQRYFTLNLLYLHLGWLLPSQTSAEDSPWLIRCHRVLFRARWTNYKIKQCLKKIMHLISSNEDWASYQHMSMHCHCSVTTAMHLLGSYRAPEKTNTASQHTQLVTSCSIKCL